MSYRIVYTADVHGNEVQYKKLVQRAIDTNAHAVVIGGDIAPKGISIDRFIESQRFFFEKRLPDLVRPLSEQTPRIKLFLMMGNDDCVVNNDVFERFEGELYQIIHGKRLSLTNNFDIVGYSYVPITPFGIKDWEKFDLSFANERVRNDYAQRKRSNYRFDGFKSTVNGWVPFHFQQGLEKFDSIQKDLGQELFTKNSRKTVYVIHTPPNNTCLDQIANHRHVGSFAVRSFVEVMQPYVTLHGHIHETVDVSGNFREVIGDSICLSPGNDNESNNLAVISFDAYDLRTIQRKTL